MRILCGTFLNSIDNVVSNMLFPIFVFRNNQDKRSARGADPTTARTPLATAYAARYARVIPVIAPYLNPAARRMLAMTGSTKIGLILWREAGWGTGEEYARHETMRRERRAAEPPRSVSKMQSAVTNGADSRAHRILERFESLRGLKV